MKKKEGKQQKELRKTENIAGKPWKVCYENAMRNACTAHRQPVTHTSTSTHTRTPAHTHSHAVGCTNFSVAYFVALEIFMAIFQASDARQEEPAKCEAKGGANGIVALKCGQRRTKTVQERATTKVRPKEKDRERQRGIKEWGEMWLVK